MKCKEYIDTCAVRVGAHVRFGFRYIGSVTIFFWRAITVRWRYSPIVDQLYALGVKSLPLIVFISVFVGFISAVSFVIMTGGMGRNYLGTALIKAVLVEMGPTFTGLILAGRIGAKMASEIGSMVVTEQIDAMTCLSLNPLSFVVNPRIVACTTMGPIFFIVSSVAALVSAQVFTTLALQVSPYIFYNSMRLLFSLDILLLGLSKSITFSTLIGIFGCYSGYTTVHGALGVGKSTRDAVVMSCLSILLANFLLTLLW